MADARAEAVQVERVGQGVVPVRPLHEAETTEACVLVLTDADQVEDVLLPTRDEADHVARGHVVVLDDVPRAVGADFSRDLTTRLGDDLPGRKDDAAPVVGAGDEVEVRAGSHLELPDDRALLAVHEHDQPVAAAHRVAVVVEVIGDLGHVTHIDRGRTGGDVVRVSRGVRERLVVGRHGAVRVVELVDVDILLVDDRRRVGRVEEGLHDLGEQQVAVTLESGVVQRPDLLGVRLGEEHPRVADGNVVPAEVEAHDEGLADPDALRLSELGGLLEVLGHRVEHSLRVRRDVPSEEVDQGLALAVPESQGGLELAPHRPEVRAVERLPDHTLQLVESALRHLHVTELEAQRHGLEREGLVDPAVRDEVAAQVVSHGVHFVPF